MDFFDVSVLTLTLGQTAMGTAVLKQAAMVTSIAAIRRSVSTATLHLCRISTDRQLLAVQDFRWLRLHLPI